MSEAAKRDLALKRNWAEPGSRHDRLVRAAKFALPVLIGGLPAARQGDFVAEAPPNTILIGELTVLIG